MSAFSDPPLDPGFYFFGDRLQGCTLRGPVCSVVNAQQQDCCSNAIATPSLRLVNFRFLKPPRDRRAPQIFWANVTRGCAGTHPRSLGSRVRPNVLYRSDFPHPISHRTPHYRVGNGRIRWMVISQKRLNFGTKRNCTIQGKMGCNGLGNRCSI
jgi:hypothetical protein